VGNSNRCYCAALIFRVEREGARQGELGFRGDVVGGAGELDAVFAGIGLPAAARGVEVGEGAGVEGDADVAGFARRELDAGEGA
jgi:hypothetical protein